MLALKPTSDGPNPIMASRTKPKMNQTKDFMYNTALKRTGKKFNNSQRTFRISDPMILSNAAITAEFLYFPVSIYNTKVF
jgi:hypothetical protein